MTVLAGETLPPGVFSPPHSGEQMSRGAPTWVSAVSHLDPKYGGLSSAVPALASAVATGGRQTVALAGFCRPAEQYQPAVSDGVSLHYLPLGHLSWWKDAPARQTLRRMVGQAAGVHIHGLWQLSTTAAARAATSAGKPYLVSAHGMLEAWALANKQFKKKVYGALFERSNLGQAACLHALTETEVRDYRNFGLQNPVAVIPNGVTVPVNLSPDFFLRRFPALQGKRLVLFLGRLHFKKGLDILAEAWAQVSRCSPEAHLVLAGPDSENTQAQVAKRLSELRISERVTFTGMLAGELKWSALAASECFVLPSYSEGLSVSVLEAMGTGLPVVISQQCNLPEVARYECGWTVRARADELAAALTQMLGASDEMLRRLGENGRRLVGSRYSWPVVGRQMAELYGWLGGGLRPTTFPLDEVVPR